MDIYKIYEAERHWLSRKFPTLGFQWETRKLIEQIVSPLLESNEANTIYQKIQEGLHAKAKQHTNDVVQLIEVDKRRALYRIVIAVRWLREYFADELTEQDDSSGGGRKSRLNSSSRFGRW